MHRVAVEVIVLRAAPAGGLAYRRQVSALAPDGDPDGAASSLAGGVPAVGLLHSTSWRRDPAWGLLLTYVALPDQQDTNGAVPLDRLAVAVGCDARTPSPPAVTVDEVAAHAIRHLALLRRTDSAVAGALAGHPALDTAISAADPLPAGQLT